MIDCTRFVRTIFVAFAYACLEPLLIIIIMGSAGWYWILNDTAFGFFMMFVFPFAIAAFACVFDPSVVKGAIRPFSRRTVPIIVFGLLMAVLARGVHNDIKQTLTLADGQRLPQAYMFRDSAIRTQLNSVYAQAFKSHQLNSGLAEYRKVLSHNPPPSTLMIGAISIFNFINAGCGVAVFCYVWLLATPLRGPDGLRQEKIPPDVTNHLIFTITAFAVWFPCRAYADWHMNFGTVDWLRSYTAAIVLAVMLLACCFIVGFNMAAGSLYARFVAPVGVTASLLGAVAAWKPWVLPSIARSFSSWDAVFQIATGMLFCIVVFYVSSTIHQYSSCVPTLALSELRPTERALEAESDPGVS